MSLGGHAARNGGSGAPAGGKIPNVIDLNIQSFLFRMSIICLVSYHKSMTPSDQLACLSIV